MPGVVVTRRIARLDPVRDADEIARLSLVVLHGSRALTYALFTVAFMKQVAVPAMARTLHRRGTGEIIRSTALRNDDTIVFFGQLLDHGPESPTIINGRLLCGRTFIPGFAACPHPPSK